MLERQELYDVANCIHLLFKKMKVEWQKSNPTGMAYSQTRILEELASNGPQKPSVLADMLDITTGGITGLADKLIENGTAQRIRVEGDRRCVYLDITEDGRKTLQEAIDNRNEFIQRLFGQLDPAEAEQITKILQSKILSQFE
ncbi:MarR family winged helix-turn-helix transcriptional regulator [Brevibacillus dissolubilis]|uniref:MarR family winged helix-turn-helix transcriptional regulator n=1 Tax=Brevibacillus dissolubilis TaxID=1844116 RepID=UPI001115F87B|nr:MarR family transcriptional regulator [Brevibacillus dissolubilis]